MGFKIQLIMINYIKTFINYKEYSKYIILANN